jgi:hypothetical protein
MQKVEVAHDTARGVGNWLPAGSWLVVGTHVDAVTVGGTMMLCGAAAVVVPDRPSARDVAVNVATTIERLMCTATRAWPRTKSRT